MNALNAGIYTALSSGTALTALLGGTSIYHLQAPDDAALPYVVYSWQGGGRVGFVPNLTDQLEFIRAYGTTAYQAGTIDGAITALLDGVAISVTGWTVAMLHRQDDFESVETLPSGDKTYAMGGIYRVVMDK